MMADILNTNRLDIWHVLCSDLDEDVLAHAEAQILSPDERERMHRFRLPADRRLYLTSRFLLRSMLLHFTGIAAEDWRFRYNEYGKPRPEKGFPQVCFNLSHSDGLAICALHPCLEVGIDVEPRHRQIDAETALSVLIQNERQAYQDAAEECKAEVFLRYWVLKEAYVKAVGKGFSFPFTDFHFELDRAFKPQLRLSNEAKKCEQDFLFFELAELQGYLAAVAIRKAGGRALELCVRPLVRDDFRGFRV